MANISEVKRQMIELNPNNQDWTTWVNKQKRVDNLTNGDGQLRPRNELERLFVDYQRRHQITQPIANNNILQQIEVIEDIGTLDDIKANVVRRITLLKEKAIKEKAEIATKHLQYLKDIGFDINSIIEQFI